MKEVRPYRGLTRLCVVLMVLCILATYLQYKFDFVTLATIATILGVPLFGIPTVIFHAIAGVKEDDRDAERAKKREKAHSDLADEALSDEALEATWNAK